MGWCGRGDGGMIFNSDDLEVAPPHKLALATETKLESMSTIPHLL